MEPLKSIDEINLPDSRCCGYRVVDKLTGIARAYTVVDHHTWISRCALGEHVPEDIRDSFDTARNLLLYSWYVYRFIPVAQLQLAACSEMAFKSRLGLVATGEAEGVGFKKVLEMARKEKLLNGVVYSRSNSEHEFVAHAPGQSDEEWFYDRVSEVLRMYRNELAHGASLLYPDGGFILRVVGETINYLFKASDNELVSS